MCSYRSCLLQSLGGELFFPATLSLVKCCGKDLFNGYEGDSKIHFCTISIAHTEPTPPWKTALQLHLKGSTTRGTLSCSPHSTLHSHPYPRSRLLSPVDFFLKGLHGRELEKCISFPYLLISNGKVFRQILI